VDKTTVVARLMVDLKANPKKIGILALLLAVAVYFWIPLVGQLFASSGSTRSIPPQPFAIAQAAPVPVSQSQSQSWRETTEAISNDPHTKPPPDVPWQRDPFVTTIEPEELVEEIVEEDPIEEIVDVQVQLLLKGTLVSPNKKTALINDESYQQGETIDLADGFVVRLREVTSRYVVLEANGVRIELQLNTPTTVDTLQFRTSN